MVKPQFFNTLDKARLVSKSGYLFVDAFENQTRELFFIQNHEFVGMSKSEAYKTKEFENFLERNSSNHVFIYLPWQNTIIKTVKKDSYLSLITNRNQDLITPKEQQELQNFKVVVLGMSVGSNIAIVLRQAGISNEIALADFDELDTTNLNRILGGIHQIGLNKIKVASRRIYEHNPFAKVRELQDGINKKNLEDLLGKHKFNCIVEEVDSMPIKIETRKLAMKYKVPVMIISEIINVSLKSYFKL